MKILYIHRTQGRGGEGVHITSVVRALRESGHVVDVISPPGIDPFSTAGDSPVDKSEIRSTGIRRLWTFLSKRVPQSIFEMAEIAYNIYLFPLLLGQLLRGGYDFIYERYAFLNIAPAVAASLLGIPRGLEVNEVCGVKRARDQKFLWLMEVTERYTMRRATALFPVSSFLKRKIVERGISGERVRVVPNAVHPEMFEKVGVGDEVRRSLGIEGKVVIGFAGWFDHWDMLELLVKIFFEIRSSVPCHLLLIGSGRMMGSLKDLIDELDISEDVTLTGPVPRADVVKFLDALDVAVITHSNEFGSPMVLFEFIALGKCIVAPKLDPMTDVLEDGKDALLFDPGNWDEMRIQLGEVVARADLRRRLGISARTKAMQSHTWGTNAETILDAFRMKTGSAA